MTDQSNVERQIVVCFRCASKQRFPTSASKVKCSKCGAYPRYSEPSSASSDNEPTGDTRTSSIQLLSPVWGAGLAGSSSVLAVALIVPRTPSTGFIVIAAAIAFAVGASSRAFATWLFAVREQRRIESAKREHLMQLKLEQERQLLERERQLIEEQRRREEAERQEADIRKQRVREQWERENARKQREYEQRLRDEQEMKRRALAQIDGWKRLSPYDFEIEVARLLRACGAHATVTTQTGDGGVDVDVTFEGHKYAVQCKRFVASQVGRPDCQNLLGVVISEGYTGGIIITTSTLSAKAREFCVKNRSRVVALAGNDLIRLASSPNADALRLVVTNCRR